MLVVFFLKFLHLFETQWRADVDAVEVEAFGTGFDDVDGLDVGGHSLEGEGVDEHVVAAAVVGEGCVLGIEGDAVGGDQAVALARGEVADIDVLVDGETLVVEGTVGRGAVAVGEVDDGLVVLNLNLLDIDDPGIGRTALDEGEVEGARHLGLDDVGGLGDALGGFGLVAHTLEGGIDGVALHGGVEGEDDAALRASHLVGVGVAHGVTAEEDGGAGALERDGIVGDAGAAFIVASRGIGITEILDDVVVGLAHVDSLQIGIGRHIAAASTAHKQEEGADEEEHSCVIRFHIHSCLFFIPILYII